jgi:uncharacterized protein HemX
MAISASDWTEVRDKIVNDLKDGVNVSSMTIAGQTFSYRSLSEQLELLKYAENAALGAEQSGIFALAKFVDL